MWQENLCFGKIIMYACLAEISLEKGRVGMSTLEVIYEIMKQKW